MEHLNTLVEVAGKGFRSRIVYRKPGEKDPLDVRIVEPLKFLESAAGDISVRCWQVMRGADSTESGWKAFRIDRIEKVEPTDIPFKTIKQTQLTTGEVSSFKQDRREMFGKEHVILTIRAVEVPGTDADSYFDYLKLILMDGRIENEERRNAESMAIKLSPACIKVAHAKIFADILHECAVDGVIDRQEEIYIAHVRNFLDALGWSP